jgi:DNA (cytosine-5)-methyltransferase 1
MARLHGFPDWFRFHATKWHGARQVGNAVAPPLARAIAEEVTWALGLKSRRPVRIVELGDERLLNFDLSEAADHFAVQRPPSRRDRKSGARKRKQQEIEAEQLLFSAARA